ncbi:homoserine dehydrogenase [Inquilinus sp.]|uniref:homoserine dehydrogenase n=1 Tax=Inquilinus sp. TaxID=1932117 RepID=UPI0031D53E17
MLINAALIGLGSVNRNLLTILAKKAEELRRDHGIGFRIILVADSRGVAADPGGFDPAGLVAHKAAGGSTADLPGYRGAVPVESLLDGVDLVFEASPVDLRTGGPGLALARAALGRGISVVLANKGPVVLAFRELHEAAARSGARLKYSATVCGGLPVLNIGRRDMIAGEIRTLRGVFNATTNFILDQMATGVAYGDALAEAQRRGIAEADPSLDVEGWDTANKLLIIANSLLGADIALADIAVTGIAGVTQESLAAEAARGNVIRLVASAEAGRYAVAPLALPATDFLAQCRGWEMAVEMHTDIYGISYHKLWEREPTPTAASMLRDAVHIFAGAEGV